MTLYTKEKKKWADNLMPEVVWTPTYLGLLVFFLWKSESGETLILIPVLILFRAILEYVYMSVFGEKRRSFPFLATTFVAQCIAWSLVIYLGIFLKT